MRHSITLVALLAVLVAEGTTAPAGPPTPPERQAFDKAYGEWRAFIGSRALGSRDTEYIDNEPFQAIIRCGPRAVPFIIEKLANEVNGSHFLVHALAAITKKKFPREQRMAVVGNQGYATLWIAWWRHGKVQTAAQFQSALNDWRALRERGETRLWTTSSTFDPDWFRIDVTRETTRLGQAFLGMADLGIEALPLVVEAIGEGQADLAPLIYYLTDSKVMIQGNSPDTIRTRALSWWARDRERWELPDRPDQLPEG